MEFQQSFPIWDKLTAQQQSRLLGSLMTRTVKKGRCSTTGAWTAPDCF